MNIIKIYKLSKSKKLEDKQIALNELNKIDKTGHYISATVISKRVEMIITILVLIALNIFYFLKLSYPWFYIVAIDVFMIFFIFLENYNFNKKKLKNRIGKYFDKNPIEHTSLNTHNNISLNEDIERIKERLK